MSIPFGKGRLSFQAKVLIPVLALLILLPAVTLAIIHRSSMDQLQRDAHQKLKTADAVFRNSLDIRGKHLISRYKNIVNEPRFKATSHTEHPKTMSKYLHDLLDELGEETEFILYIRGDGELAAAARKDTSKSLDEIEQVSRAAVEQAITGQPDCRLGAIEHQVYQTVAVPVLVNDMVWALVVGVRVGENALQELNATTRAEVILFADGEVAATTLRSFDRSHLPKFKEEATPTGLVEPILFEQTHYVSLSAPFAKGQPGFGYVLLSSYEHSLQQLKETNAALWLLSSIGISISALVIWLVIGRITAPLRQLRSSAEAVGAGDFTQRVFIRSNDEFGQLGQTFNQMTRNLQHSHAELRKTVETLKATQAQLIESEKLSAVGEFVAGIAHELNNPLTSVIGFAELLSGANLSPKHQNYLTYIVKSSERCHKIVQGLLSFARQHPPERKLVNANDLLEGVLDILAYEMRTSNIEVQRCFDSALPQMVGDAHQLQQVFLNILNNARQAMEQSQPSGRIRLTTESAAEKIRIIFEDNGPGIPREILSRIFDPFFTTKPVGKGTGLGLSLCYGIINEHGGSITAHSEPNNGATFVVELPARVATNSEPESDDSAPEKASLNGTGRKVLVVDDEEWILELVKQILKRDGFDVDVARNGETAVTRVAETKYELLVCDWKMPGLSGPQLFEQIAVVNPRAAERTIFMTGDVVSENFQAFLKKHSKSCLSKPFSVQEFRETIGAFVSRNGEPAAVG